MNDKELLELAAKAAGFAEIDFLSDDGLANVYDSSGRHSAWNPLTNDGDALRLLVKCRLDIEWRGDGRLACFHNLNDKGICYPNSCESSREDADANLRRAIVRAAATIGKGMPWNS